MSSYTSLVISSRTIILGSVASGRLPIRLSKAKKQSQYEITKFMTILSIKNKTYTFSSQISLLIEIMHNRNMESHDLWQYQSEKISYTSELNILDNCLNKSNYFCIGPVFSVLALLLSSRSWLSHINPVLKCTLFKVL